MYLAALPAPANDAAPDHVVLSMGSMSKGRIEHETKVVELALEKSRDQYGDYDLSVHETIYSRPRAIRALQLGEVVNAVSSPELTFYTDIQPAPLITIDIPILQGMLGKRHVIVRRDRLQEFASLSSVQQLQGFTAGLGFDWIDQLFFEHNQLPFNTGTDINQLFTMLQHGRFDYLPLGVVEARPALAKSGLADELAIVDKLLIHYPLPVYIQVSANKPRLAERLRFGLQKAKDDGSLDKLFNQYYGKLVEASANAVVIELENLP